MGILLKGLTLRNKAANRSLPCNADLLEDSRGKLQGGDGHTDPEFGRVWTSTLLPFMFLLRGRELAALELLGISLG